MTGSGEAPGQLVLVATPIGHLGDLSPRAREVLAGADLICCEDTRRTRALLSAAGIGAGGRLLSLHAHNEAARLDRVTAEVAAGGVVAVVSDAGMPGISDPGSLLVAALAAAGHRVSVVPGPSAALAALVVSGLPTERFGVEGFLPRKGVERRERIAAMLADQRTSVLFEAPGRVASTLAELATVDGERPVAVARELTKVFEEVWRGTMAEAAAEFAQRQIRGEVVLVVGGAALPGPVDDADIDAAVRRRLEAGDGPRQAADAVAPELGVARRRVYEMAVRLRDETSRPG